MATREPLLRPGGKGPNDPWIRVGNVNLGTVGVATAFGVLSFLLYAISPDLTAKLALFPQFVRSGEIWRLLTWPLANVPGIWTALGLAIFYYFGNQLEVLMGRKRMLNLLLLLTIVGSATALIVDLLGIRGSGSVLAGIDAIQLAFFVGFAIEYPGARMFFGISARVMVLVLLGLSLLQYLGERNWSEIIVTVATIATIGIFLRSINLAIDLPWIPKLALGKPGTGKTAPRAKAPKSSGRSSSPAKKSKRSGGLSVVPSPSPNAVPLTPREVDALLEKISTSGMASLTPEERANLEAASNRMRDKEQ